MISGCVYHSLGCSAADWLACTTQAHRQASLDLLPRPDVKRRTHRQLPPIHSVHVLSYIQPQPEGSTGDAGAPGGSASTAVAPGGSASTAAAYSWMESLL